MRFLLDIRPVCRGIASQSADPGIGQGGQAENFQQCMESEQRVHEQLRKVWASFSAADKQHCVTLAKTGESRVTLNCSHVWKWPGMCGFCILERPRRRKRTRQQIHRRRGRRLLHPLRCQISLRKSQKLMGMSKQRGRTGRQGVGDTGAAKAR
jgi:hypothetical protein